jgi:hypothetical protein
MPARFAIAAISAFAAMPQKPIEIPPTAARAFMHDLIAGDQMLALREQMPGDKPINLLGVKDLLHALKDRAGRI